MNVIKELSQHPLVRHANLLIKFSLAIAFFIAIVVQPEAVEGKGMLARAPLFMASSILIPLIFWLRGKNFFSSRDYPHIADALIAAPFLLDTLGNLLGFYDEYQSTDDVLHFINWFFLIPGIMALVFLHRKTAKDFVLIGAGISAMAIIGWEVFEWLISDAGPFAGDLPDRLSLSYGDTIGDLIISFAGGLVGVVLARSVFFKAKK